MADSLTRTAVDAETVPSEDGNVRPSTDTSPSPPNYERLRVPATGSLTRIAVEAETVPSVDSNVRPSCDTSSFPRNYVPLWELRYRAYVNHYYFESLASLYLFLDKTIRILSLISASATFATLVPAFPLLCKVIAAGVSFFTILGNVWGFAKDATTLADLKVAWLDFARKIDSKWDQFYSDSPVSEQDMKKLENDQKGLESSGGRFPTFERLRKLAQDRACDRLKAPRELR